MQRIEMMKNPAFSRWFGTSRVVDAGGTPLVMYHGTAAAEDFNEFETGWFTNDPDMAEQYSRKPGGRLIAAYLRIERPIKMSQALEQAQAHGIVPRTEAFDVWLRERYDGLDHSSGGILVLIPFRPEQIKSAIGNCGAYDPLSADILK